MTGSVLPTTAVAPRWDGRRILFEVADGDHAVPCAISINALQDLGAQRRHGPGDLLKCFNSARERIEAIALAKNRTRGQCVSGLLHIWADDIDDPPPADTQVAARMRVVLRVA